MGIDRREFIAGVGLVGGVALLPAAALAVESAAEFLATAKTPEGTFVLCGLDGTLKPLFEQPLPARAHDIARHPKRSEAVVFARRPGRFALVFDPATGSLLARFEPKPDRHFYGHGVFTPDGRLLLATENDFENARGVIGIYDRQSGYQRIGEFSSGGVGPHDLGWVGNGRTLIVANGGIETHPEMARRKLNLNTMAPNLSVFDRPGEAPARTLRLSDDHYKLSIRHLAISSDGRVIVAMQNQDPGRPTDPLLAVGATDGALKPLEATPRAWGRMRGYCGDVSLDASERFVAASSPRGGVVQLWSLETLQLISVIEEPDVCGLARTAHPGQVLASSGNATLQVIGAEPVGSANLTDQKQKRAWDNHIA